MDKALPPTTLGHDGTPIRINSAQGTLQRGRNYTETVGSLCHEYGHILGLPDLYNTGFLQSDETSSPADDSAGIGNWGLMGWGTLGWNRNDGPNSFSAWSRAHLGWVEVRTIEQPSQTIELSDVGQSGVVYRIPVTNRETYWLEYRRRDSTYYDRNMPAEGLLIWHARTPDIGSQHLVRFQLDLECADGLWQEGGFPLGRVIAPQTGGDNLDFWAHDADYTTAHGGNLGDATDPFDGVRFTAFTPEGNPSSRSEDGQSSIRIESIRIEDGVVKATISAAPPRLGAVNLHLEDADRDQVLAAGEESEVWFWVVNRGGLAVSQVRAVLSSDDPLVEILVHESHFEDLPVGAIAHSPLLSQSSLLRFRIRNDFTGTHTTTLSLDLYTGEEVLGQYTLNATAGAAQQRITDVTLIDTLGNDDGQAQIGEIVTLTITLADQHPDILPKLKFSLHPLDERVQSLDSPIVRFRLDEVGSTHSTQGPRFLLPSTLIPGTMLDFALRVEGPLGTWEDTLQIAVAEGRDETPPQVDLVRTRISAANTIDVLLSERWVRESSEIASVRAVFYQGPDSTRVAIIPLHKDGGEYTGTWAAAAPGDYLVAVEVVDAEGNRGGSTLRSVRVRQDILELTGAGVSTSEWTSLGLPEHSHPVSISGITIAPSRSEILYAHGADGLWRSVDGGQNWEPTGLMGNGLFSYSQTAIDPQDPLTLYIVEFDQALKSTDGGQTWNPVLLPSQDVNTKLLAVDDVLPGRLYGYSTERQSLVISDDEGRHWWERPLSSRPNQIFSHPLAPHDLYLILGGTNSAELWRSADDGQTWQVHELLPLVRYVLPDPAHPEGLYGVFANAIWYSPDGGATWSEKSRDSSVPIKQLVVHPARPEVLYGYSWSSATFWVSQDRGETWTGIETDKGISSFVPHPADVDRGYLIHRGNYRNELWEIEEYGQVRQRIELSTPNSLAGAMAFDAQGKLNIASVQDGEGGLFIDQGGDWQWLPEIGRGGIVAPLLNMLYLDTYQIGNAIGHFSLSLNRYIRSNDAGLSWRSMPTPEASTSGSGQLLRFFPKIVPDPQHPGVLYMSGQQVYRSEDAGGTWDQRGLLPTLSSINSIYNFIAGNVPVVGLSLDPLDERHLYAAKADRLWFSENAGDSWVEIGTIRAGEPVLDMVFHPLDTDLLLTVTVGGIYGSVDRGQTWAPLFRPEGVRWLGARLRFAPSAPDYVYLMTSRYLYESRDGGSNWQLLEHGLAGFSWFNDLQVDPLNPERLYLATTWGAFTVEPKESIISAVEERRGQPATFSLEQNYPNPFSAQTIITYQLPKTGAVELSIYNILGQRVMKLVDEVQAAGEYRITWNGTDDAGRVMGSGLFFCRLSTDSQVQMRRMVLLK